MDHDKKVNREQREAKEKAEKIADTINILNWQNDNRVTACNVDKDKRLHE